MAIPSSTYTEAVTAAVESRTKKAADNMSDNNAILYVLRKRGNIKPVSGGTVILQELNYADNVTAQWYSGYDNLDVSASNILTSAYFPYAEGSVQITMSGLEMAQNSGEERMIDLASARIDNAFMSLENMVAAGLHSDGTGSGGKQLTGLQAAVPTDPTTGTYGGINRATWTFWRPTRYRGVTDGGAAVSSATIGAYVRTLMNSLTRGKDKPDLLVADGNYFGFLQTAVAATQIMEGKSDLIEAGFSAFKYFGADVVLDGGIGGNCLANRLYALNTDYIHFRPHRDYNFVRGEKRISTNQDAFVLPVFFKGQLTVSNSQLQGNLQA